MATPSTGEPVRADPRKIPDSVKEAVVDALLNTVSSRLSGGGEFGRIIFATRPRNALASGFLLPMEDPDKGDEETASIRICSQGMDLLVAADSTHTVHVRPRCSVYVRVFPTADEILRHPNCDPKFSIKKEIANEIRVQVRERSKEEVRKLPGGWKDPQWKAIEHQIRTDVYKKYGIQFSDGAVREVQEDTPEDLQQADGDDQPDTGIQISGRTNLPDHIATEANTPQKWVRLDFDLPPLEFRLDNIGAAIAAATTNLNESITFQLGAWLLDADPIRGGAAWGFCDTRKIKPSDMQNWDAFVEAARKGAAKSYLPKIDLRWNIRVQPDYLNPGCSSLRIALENASIDPTPRSAGFRETDPAVFQVSLDVTIPKAMHRYLMADRVEPSYRYYEYLPQAAQGMNGGVEVDDHGDALRLRTTWTPRYYQPRLVPTSLTSEGVVANIEGLSQPTCVTGLRPLVGCFRDWLNEVKKRPVEAGIDHRETELIARERDQFEQDKGRWEKELEAVDVGITLLEESASHWKGPGAQPDQRAVPFEAWLSMNATMAAIAKSKGYDEWRLFQLAFILANLSALVTRMPEFQDRYPALEQYINSVTLLYFATGGGKSEAFLGLLAFNLFLDRLRGKERGVTAMLRYPLRLLTLQQAQRTAKTLAKAELVRRVRKHPGEPFTVGFWVGSTNTPNSLSHEDVRALPDVMKYPGSAEQKLLDSDNRYVRALERWNKLPVCPFCSHEKGTGLRRFPALGGLLGHLCLNGDCTWNSAYQEPTPLPFYIVDEDIYELPPSVLLGTVDKLALLGQSQRTIRRFLGMFGFAPGYRAGNGRLYSPDPKKREELAAPQSEQPFVRLFPTYADGQKRFFDPYPSLLIQDEAHLLDESLGTFAGLFETAMDAVLDELSPLLGDQVARDQNGKRRRVKVVAASATVSDPQHQMRSIYQRGDTVQFPYPGPELYRSFYAAPKGPDSDEPERQALPEKDVEGRSHWARVYQSILTNGHTHTVTVVDVLANFHVTITSFYERLRSGDLAKVAQARADLVANLTLGNLTPLFERAITAASDAQLVTILDLHRIALTYVTNKKGGDQIMAAESTEFDKTHKHEGLEGYRLDTDLITGAVDAGHIQEVIRRAEDRPAVDGAFPELNETLRSIVATSAVSHGVDVEELNSMFFAGMPSDIAEYIQASSRVGRTHVGFCVLVPTPQRVRDRFIVEVHAIFHRFLERMITPAAIDRWAEKAVERVISSFLQAYLCGVVAARSLAQALDIEKSHQNFFKTTRDVKNASHENALGFRRDIAQFVEYATGLRLPYAPQEKAYYEDLIRARIKNIYDDLFDPLSEGAELGNFLTTRNVDQRPMTSLRDVDKPGQIVPSRRDTRGNRSIDAETFDRLMRVIRGGSGAAIDADEDTKGE